MRKTAEAPPVAVIPKHEVSSAIDAPVVTPPEVPKPPAIKPAVVAPAESPTVAEVPKATEEPKVRHESPRDLGRGGAPHQAIQERLQAEAQKLGFHSEVEKQLTPGSNAAADLVLRRDQLAIAVEITVTTTTSHEFENVQKCLAAGFERVAVIATSPKRLADIAAAVQGGLGSEAAKVSYHSPDEFIHELHKLAAKLNAQPEPALPTREGKIRGIKVRRHSPKLSGEETAQREKIINQMLGVAMRRPK